MKVAFSERVEAELDHHFSFAVTKFGRSVAQRTFFRVRSFLLNTLAAYPYIGVYRLAASSGLVRFASQVKEERMDAMERRVFLQGAGMGMLAFTVGGTRVMMTPREARAQGVPFRLLKADEAETIEALGETLVPGARRSGVAHFIDQQIAVPPGEALLEARQLNVRPPFANFYRAAIGAVDRASMARGGRSFAALAAADQHDFVDLMRQNKIDGWQGPPGAFVYTVLRSDAVDVVYGTMEGYQQLGVPYMAHIAPQARW